MIDKNLKSEIEVKSQAQSQDQIKTTTNTKAELKRLWQSVRSLLFFFVLLYFIPQIENWIGQDNIKNFLTSAGIWAPILFILVRLVTVIIAPLKLGPITAIMHRAFGLWPSLLYTVIVVVLEALVIVVRLHLHIFLVRLLLVVVEILSRVKIGKTVTCCPENRPWIYCCCF